MEWLAESVIRKPDEETSHLDSTDFQQVFQDNSMSKEQSF